MEQQKEQIDGKVPEEQGETEYDIEDKQKKNDADQKFVQSEKSQMRREDLKVNRQEDQRMDNCQDQFLGEQSKVMILEDQRFKSEENQETNSNQPTFSQLHPASDKFASKSSKLSLQYDIKLGWVPKAQITGPIPLAYAHPDSDQIISEKADKGLVIFYGPRFNNSFEIHGNYHQKINQKGEINKKYPFLQFHLCKSKFLEAFFRKHYSEFEYDHERPIGMVKTQRKQPETLGCQKVPDDQPLTFDSNFEGGNLDAVYYQTGEYRLFLRTDSNTKGHCNYFYFKVKSLRPGNFCFRIMNMSKPASLYERGMRPYVRITNNNIKEKWSQEGATDVRYGWSPLNQEYQDLSRKMFSLRFEYCFGQKKQKGVKKGELIDSNKNLEVEFCYGIPFVYSDLVHSLDEHRNNDNFHLNKLCYSLSGVQIPLVTITEAQLNSKRQNSGRQTKQNQQEVTGDNKQKETVQQKNKYVVAILGRVHPGETHGSHIINGLISSLLENSAESKLLRSHLIFKIIPMLNPDGVIAGNTRTSFAGKDLNRVYNDYIQFVYPEIIGVRDYIKKLKQKYKKKFLFVIDVHGHSTRKNSFFFGPEYPVFDQQYNKCRMLARIFANITEVFRYYSCKFRLATSKEHTCRGYFNSKNIVRIYTHETSIHSYFNFSQRQDTPFTQQLLENLGRDMLLAIHNYVVVTLGLKSLEIPEPVKRKKVRRRIPKPNDQLQVVQVEEEATDSDEMQSDGADSEDQFDDFEPAYLQTFYNKINENKEYFYEELLAANKIDFKKLPKKKLKSPAPRKDSQPATPLFKQVCEIRQIQLQANLLLDEKDKKRKKNEWVPKIEYVNRKKEFVSYQKLNNYMLNAPENIVEKQKEQSSAREKKKASHSKKDQRFHLVTLSPIKNLTETNLQEKHMQQHSNTDLLKTSARKKSNSTHRLSVQSISKIAKNHEEIGTPKKKYLPDMKKIEQILSSHEPFNLITQSESKLTLSGNEGLFSTHKGSKSSGKNVNTTHTQKFDLKLTNSNMGDMINTSRGGESNRNSQLVPLRQFPRKKSIKSFKDEDEVVNKKLAKVKKNDALAKKLPYLSKLAQKL